MRGRPFPPLPDALATPGEMTEWPKVHDWKSCVPARVPRVRIPLSPPGKTSGSANGADPRDEGASGPICRSVCTPIDAGVLKAAIDRLTAALATADDDMIAELVSERRALREELRALSDGAGVVLLGGARLRLRPKR
jgi:hypothetical protein